MVFFGKTSAMVNANASDGVFGGTSAMVDVGNGAPPSRIGGKRSLPIGDAQRLEDGKVPASGLEASSVIDGHADDERDP